MPARFGFAADPRAIEDLRHLPTTIRDLALLQLQGLVHGEQRGTPLGTRAGVDLSGYRRLHVDPDAEWRIVFRERAAPPRSRLGFRREIFVIAIGAREAHEVYNTAARRLGRLPDHTPTPQHLSVLNTVPRTPPPATALTNPPPGHRR
ncbi:type II toxin-antitoxin system RelE family toxin [Streptomyces sedi]|nr:hypothetical protein [Streptomyces sedi]